MVTRFPINSRFSQARLDFELFLHVRFNGKRSALQIVAGAYLKIEEIAGFDTGAGPSSLLANRSGTASYQSSIPWPLLAISAVRSKLMNCVPSPFLPIVRTVTRPCPGLDADSRFARTSDSA